MRSLNVQDNGARVDKNAMKRLLEIAAYRYERRRDLDLYVKALPVGTGRIMVLDNELALYATTIEDVVLRKSPTIKEMLNIRNAIKILDDRDVVVCKKTDSVSVLRKECTDTLDLSMSKSDLEAIATDGRIALEIEDPQEVRQCLSIFGKLLDWSFLAQQVATETLEIIGKQTKNENGEFLLGPVVIYNPYDNYLKYIEETINTRGRNRDDCLLQAAAQKAKTAGEGAAVFHYLKDIAIKHFF